MGEFKKLLLTIALVFSVINAGSCSVSTLSQRQVNSHMPVSIASILDEPVCPVVPLNNHPHHNGVVHVLFDPVFSSYERRVFVESFSSLNSLTGMRFIALYQNDSGFNISENNRTVPEIQADLVVKRWDNISDKTNYIGMYVTNTNYIQIAVNRIDTEEQLRNTFLHEAGHWLGMHHICDKSFDQLTYRRTNPELGQENDCVPGLVGDAIMNPAIGSDDAITFSALDRIEYQRVLSCDRRYRNR